MGASVDCIACPFFSHTTHEQGSLFKSPKLGVEQQLEGAVTWEDIFRLFFLFFHASFLSSIDFLSFLFVIS